MDTDTLKQRLYDRTVLSDEKSCWLWLGCTRGIGYGAMRDGNSVRDTHRISYEVHVGPIPDGMFVLHTCDIPNCINPYHLFIGTNADNMADKKRKGRAQRGEQVPNTYFTEDQVRAIHEKRKKGETHREIAASYGAPTGTITSILSGKRWKYIYAEMHKENQA